MSEKTIITRPGWEIVVFDDGTINICTLADDLLLSPSEFDKLALQSPLVQRMVEFVKKSPEYEFDKEFDNYYCHWCEWGKGVEHDKDCPRQQLLAEIEKLEAK